MSDLFIFAWPPLSTESVSFRGKDVIRLYSRGSEQPKYKPFFFLQERLPMLYQVRAARTIARSLRESAIPACCLLLFSVLPRFSVHIHSCLIVHVFSFINAVRLGFIWHFSNCKDVVNAMCRKDPATSNASDVARREQGRPLQISLSKRQNKLEKC